MKKVIAASVALVILTVVAATILTSRIESATKSVESRLGDMVILGGDTLMIVDYSMLNNTYILEDGRSVGSAFVENQQQR